MPPLTQGGIVVSKQRNFLDAQRAVSKRQEAKASQQRATGRDL